MKQLLKIKGLNFLLYCFFAVFLYYSISSSFLFSNEAEFNNYNYPVSVFSSFLVSNSKCTIPRMNPFNDIAIRFFKKVSYINCTDKEPLTYITKSNNNAFVHINWSLSKVYSEEKIICKYAKVEKKPGKNIKILNFTIFSSSVHLHDPIMIKCYSNKDKPVYENVHDSVLITAKIEEKLQKAKFKTKPIHVMILGFDGISRMNFIRTMPNTYKYLNENNWLPLEGYNKIGDNTFPNIMAIMTGMNVSLVQYICKPRNRMGLDKCPMIWKDFQKHGFVTAYAEDNTDIDTFSYQKRGFFGLPTDYYFRTYLKAAENLTEGKPAEIKYCSGPVTLGERIFSITEDFSKTFRHYATFSLIWCNSFSHSSLNMPGAMDNKVPQFLDNLKESGVFNSTLVIFLSDHGSRIGKIRLTSTGWLEERMPFLFFSIPEWFKTAHPKLYENFKNNKNKLVSPYDIFMTFQHVLILSGTDYQPKPSLSCPKCMSLLEEIPDRTCHDAGIEAHWCACNNFKDTILNKEESDTLGKYILKYIENYLTFNGVGRLCSKMSLKSVVNASVAHGVTENLDNSFYLVRLEANTSAIFESTLLVEGPILKHKFSVVGGVSRLNSYGNQSDCVHKAELKLYCYCL